MPPVCHPLGTWPGCTTARSACPQPVLSREGGRRPSWLGRVHLSRSSYQSGGFQRRPGFRRFAWCWHGSCCSPAHQWTFTLTRSLPFAAALIHLTSGRICSELPVPGRVFTPFTTSMCFLSHFTSPTGPLSPCSVCSLILNCLNSSLCSALKTFYSHEPYLHPCPSLSTKEQRPHHPSLTAVLFPFLTQESGMEAPGQL